MRIPLVFLAAWFSTMLPSARADEAVLPDGGGLTGTLTLESKLGLRFLAPNRPNPLSIDAVHHVRFPAGPLTPMRVGTLHRVLLQGGQQVTGQLLALDERELRLRTGWSETLLIPRNAIIAITHLPGFVTLVDDDFESGLNAWKTTGVPALSDRQHTSGLRSLLLSSPGQNAEYELSSPIESGRLGINVQESGPPTGALWLLEAEFQGPRGPSTFRVTLAGKGEIYRVEASEVEKVVPPVPRTPGWHRLSLAFTTGSWRVTVDDAVVAYSLKHGPGGTLRRVRLACVAAGGAEKPNGAVAFDDLSLAQAVHEPRRPAPDKSQDEFWLLTGDQLFGQVTKADRRTLEIRGRFGTSVLSWSEVRGVFMRQTQSPPTAPVGDHVRIELRSEPDAQNDMLQGIVTGLDERKLTLRHSILGALEMERGRLYRLRSLSTEIPR